MLNKIILVLGIDGCAKGDDGMFEEMRRVSLKLGEGTEYNSFCE